MPYTYFAVIVLVGVVARPAGALPRRAHATQPRSALACLGLSVLESGLLGFMAAAALMPLGVDGAVRMRAINMGIALYLTVSNLSVAGLVRFEDHLRSQHVLFYVLVCTALASEAATLGGRLAQTLGPMR